MQNKVYIAVSGCKRGFSVLYTSPGLDLGYSGIAPSLCDMRQYLRLTRPGIDFYAIDFIPGFRVCSIYRSTIDSAGSSGGFISVALIIPDNVVVADTRRLLSLLLETYYTDYYNRQFATPLPGKTEQGSNLEALLQAHAADFSVKPLHFKPGVSDFNALPLYVTGCTEPVIDTIFASPYHQAYLAGSKLIMLPAAVMAQPQTFGVAFNTDLRTIAIAPGSSDRLVGRMSAIVQQGCAVTQFMLNGTDFTSTYSSVCLLPSDRITFTVALPNGASTSFDGTVQQAVAKKILIPAADIYGFNFFPFDVAVAIRGLVTGIPRDNILLPAVTTQNEVMPLNVNARGDAHFTVRAPFSTASLMLVDSEGDRVPLNNNFLTSGNDLRAIYPIDMRALTIRFPRIIKGKAFLEIGNARFHIDITPNPLTVLIPASMQQNIFFCAGKNRWPVDPITGACDTGQEHGRGIPVWVWGAGAAILIVIIASIWYMTSHRGAPVKTPKAKTETTAVKAQNPAKTVDNDTEVTSTIDADGTVIDNTESSKKQIEEKQIEEAKDKIEDGMEGITETREEAGKKSEFTPKTQPTKKSGKH